MNTKRSKVQTTRPPIRLIACALGFMLAVGGCGATETPRDADTSGLAYHLQEIAAPLPNRVHVLRVDLTNPAIKPAVILAADPDGEGPAEAALTDPLTLAQGGKVLAFINANPWDSFPDANGKRNRHWFSGQHVDIDGLAVSAGQIRSPLNTPTAPVWFDAQGRAILHEGPGDTPVVEATAGFQRIVTDSAVLFKPDDSRHPRTAIGVDRTGTILWLVVVDGRQKGYSVGMNLHELGIVMRDLGCVNATNMDGGGSSIMGVVQPDGQLRVVNSPSDRFMGVARLLPLPMILTIKSVPAQ